MLRAALFQGRTWLAPVLVLGCAAFVSAVFMDTIWERCALLAMVLIASSALICLRSASSTSFCTGRSMC